MNNWHKGVANNWQQPNRPLSIPPPPIPPLFPPSNLPAPPIPPPPLPPPFIPSFLDPNTGFHSQNYQNPGLLEGNQWSTSPITYLPPERKQLVEDELLPDQTTAAQSSLDAWLRSKHLKNGTKKETSDCCVKIWAVKEKLNNAFSILKELENDGRTLVVLMKTVSPAEWQQKCSEIEQKKKYLTRLMNELKLSKEDLNIINNKYLKRSKKRARLKRQAERRRIQKEEEKVKTRNLHFQIDRWQNEMREAVEREQREEELQREADAVLWGVTQRKGEARRQIALLSALHDLRQVRAQRMAASGNPVSQSHIDTYNTVIDKLKKMWTKHLDDCLLEEQVLRGMLTKADIKDDPVKTYKKLVLQEWEIALFGAKGSLDSNLANDQLIDIRRSWDQFAVPDLTVFSSTIPPGWVLPVQPSTEQWRALLKY